MYLARSSLGVRAGPLGTEVEEKTRMRWVFDRATERLTSVHMHDIAHMHTSAKWTLNSETSIGSRLEVTYHM